MLAVALKRVSGSRSISSQPAIADRADDDERKLSGPIEHSIQYEVVREVFWFLNYPKKRGNFFVVNFFLLSLADLNG